MELNGTGPGTEYDQYFAYGPPDLGGATLQLTAGFDPAPGTEFMIVRNVSGEAITGTFANAPQNGFVSAPGAKIFQISYTGGDGDDVVLTRVEKGPPQIVQFQFTPAAVPGQDGNTHMVFQGVPGLTYDLEYSPDLQKWEVLKSEVAGIPAGQMIFDLAEPAAAARKFYRLTLP